VFNRFGLDSITCAGGGRQVWFGFLLPGPEQEVGISKILQITGLVWTDKQPIYQQVWREEINVITWSQVWFGIILPGAGQEAGQTVN
jgi:hypothetical protein